jgi:hypothetical protein
MVIRLKVKFKHRPNNRFEHQLTGTGKLVFGLFKKTLNYYAVLNSGLIYFQTDYLYPIKPL